MHPIPGTVTDPAVTPPPDGPSLHDLLTLATSLARVLHAGQKRKGTGERYFNHLARVAGRVHSTREKIIAFLHDTIEDTQIGYGGLAVVGFPADIITDVLALTRREGETYQDFTARTIRTGSEDALRVKLSDLQDNLDSPTLGNLRGRYVQARAHVEAELAIRGWPLYQNQAAA